MTTPPGGISGAPRGNGEYLRDQRMVLDTLQRHETKLDTIDDNINRLRNDVTILKVKAGVWGAFAGVLGGGIVGIVVNLLLNAVQSASP